MRAADALLLGMTEEGSSVCHFDRGKELPRLTEWRNLARLRISKQTPSLFMPSPFLRGKVARAAFAARDE